MGHSLCGTGIAGLSRSSVPKAVQQSPRLFVKRQFVKRQWCTVPQCAVSIGIDLGTSTSAVAALTGGRPQVLPWPDGKKTIPSVVAYAEGRLLVGHAAAQQAAQNPSNTFSSVKRIIGRSHAELLQAGHLSANVVEGPAGAAVLSSPTQGHLLPEQLSSELLRHLLQHAKLQLDDEVAHVVVTVPAHFNARQRAATRLAAQLAGFPGLELLQEPVAAALAHGLGSPSEAATILVFDLGGGTFDVSLLDSFEGIIEVLDTAGDAQLGGDDFDRCFVQWLLNGPLSGKRVSEADMQHLTAAARQAKHALSSAQSVSLQLPVSLGTPHTDVLVTRKQFEDMSQPLLQRLMDPLDTLAASAKLEWAHSGSEHRPRQMAASRDRFAPPPRRVSDLVLVGGSTYIPKVQQYIEQLTGVSACSVVHPEECVALGAAIQAAIMSGCQPGLSLMEGSSMWTEQNIL